MATFEVWLADDGGNKLENLNQFESLEYVIAPGQVGWFSLTLDYDSDLLAMDNTKVDRQIHIWRTPEGGSKALEAVYFCQRWRFFSSQGQTKVTLSGGGLCDILARRIVAYYAGSTGATISATEADDAMKDLVNGALGTASNTDYDRETISGRDITSLGFSIQADATAGPPIDRGVAWRPLLATLQDIQEQARQEDEEVFFDVVPLTTSPLTFEFRTYLNQPGSDRTSGTANALRFGTEWGNVDNPVLTYDYSNLENFIYIGGSNREDSRIIEEVSDSTSIALSQFNRREGFLAHTSSDVTGILQAAGYAQLSERRLQTTFTAEIQDTPDAPYGGNGWKAGDKVTISYLGKNFDAVIRKVRIYKSHDTETIAGSVEL